LKKWPISDTVPVAIAVSDSPQPRIEPSKLVMNTKPTQPKTRNRGSIILEVAMAYGVLMILAIYFLKSAISITSGQRWTVIQSMTDAFMTQESAIGARMPLEDIKAVGSTYPTFPAVSQTTVTIGNLPGGLPLTGTLRRTKRPDGNNLPAAGGTGTAVSNPAGMEAWKLQSFLTYNVGSRTYVKSRTTVRVR
jgi:hypothetical protein